MILKPIRTLVVDDEPLAREGLKMQIANDPDIQLVGEAENGKVAVLSICKLKPDLVFLDVQMPEMDGFAVLRSLQPEELPVIVFVTAYDQYAVKAFDSHALDYLLKPIDPERFSATLGRIKSHFVSRDLTDLSKRLIAMIGTTSLSIDHSDSREQYLRRFAIKTADRIYFVQTEEIDWIEAADYYVILHTGKKTHLIRETLTALEAKLDPKVFMRIHRSTIVNISRIKELKPHYQGEYAVILHDATSLRLSRSYRDGLSLLLDGKV
jgi:two-component system, LytTR family, response regulator